MKERARKMTATPRRTAGRLRPYEARYIPKKDSGDLLEQYKLAAEMADRVSARRGNANLLFLSIQTTLLTGAGLAYTTLRDVAWYSVLGVALTGVAISAAWWRQLQSYRLLNKAKFAVINAMEEFLPVKIFTDEWEILTTRTPSYIELGATERLVPWVFAGLQVLLMIGRLLR
jgi:hypothetical protein